MSQPTLQWDSIEGTIENIKLIYWNHPEMVWWNKIDNRYLIEVTRIGTHRDNRGKLRLFDHGKNDAEIFSLDVGLYYGAILGPDIGDVNEWKEKALEFIDNVYDKQ